MKIRNGWLLLCLLLLISTAAMAENTQMTHIDSTDVEVCARNDLHQILHCPLSTQLIQIDKGDWYLPTLYRADGKVGSDPENPHGYYSALFSYVIDDDTSALASASYYEETNALLSLSVMHHRRDQKKRLHGIDIVTQAMVDAVTAEVEKELNLSALKWQTRWDEKTGTNWGLCVPARAMTDESHLLTIYVGCDDGRLHGMDLKSAKLVDDFPAAWYRDFAYDDH